MFSQNLYDISGIIRSIDFLDILDILLVSILVYQIIRLVKETRAMQLLKGIAGILFVYFLCDIIGLKTISFIMKSVLQIGALAGVILFQPELRKALEHVGSSKLTSLNFFGPNMQPDEIATWKRSINIFSDACGRLSKKKTGALIVFEKRTKIGEIAKTGTIIDAVASVELIGNIFFVNSPLHDGAMIVRGGKIYAAGCFLPLSENYTISNELGTRHRAALGMSETSDAIVVVVSEETGVITLAQNGRLVRNLTPEQLASKLRAEFIIEPSEEGQTKIPMWKNKSKNQMK